MSIFDIFTTKPTEQAATPAVPANPNAVGEPGNIPQPTTVADPNNPTSPVAAPATPAEPKEPESPLDEFTKLWDTPTIKEGETLPSKPVPLSAEEVQKAVAKADFSKTITPENLAAIAAGGDEAKQAFATAMNAVAQQVMVQSTLVNNKLTEQAVERAVKAHTDKLPELLRNQAASNHLNETNPLFSDPAVKPIIEATQSQLLAKFPNATNAQISDMTNKYILAMGEAFAPKPATSENAAGETDWDNFLEAG